MRLRRLFFLLLLFFSYLLLVLHAITTIGSITSLLLLAVRLRQLFFVFLKISMCLLPIFLRSIQVLLFSLAFTPAVLPLPLIFLSTITIRSIRELLLPLASASVSLRLLLLAVVVLLVPTVVRAGLLSDHILVISRLRRILRRRGRRRR